MSGTIKHQTVITWIGGSIEITAREVGEPASLSVETKDGKFEWEMPVISALDFADSVKAAIQSTA